MAQRPRSTSPQPLSLARSYGRTADTTPIDLARRPPRFPRFASKSSNAATPGKASLCCRAAGSWREPFHGSVAIDAWPGTRMRADAAPSVFDGPPAASRSSKPSRQTSAQTTSEIQAMLRYECSTLFSNERGETSSSLWLWRFCVLRFCVLRFCVLLKRPLAFKFHPQERLVDNPIHRKIV